MLVSMCATNTLCDQVDHRVLNGGVWGERVNRLDVQAFFSSLLPLITCIPLALLFNCFACGSLHTCEYVSGANTQYMYMYMYI